MCSTATMRGCWAYSHKNDSSAWWAQHCEIIWRVCTLDEEWCKMCKHCALPLIHEYRESSAQYKGSIPIPLPWLSPYFGGALYRVVGFQNRAITGRTWNLYHDVGRHFFHIISRCGTCAKCGKRFTQGIIHILNIIVLSLLYILYTVLKHVACYLYQLWKAQSMSNFSKFAGQNKID